MSDFLFLNLLPLDSAAKGRHAGSRAAAISPQAPSTVFCTRHRSNHCSTALSNQCQIPRSGAHNAPSHQGLQVQRQVARLREFNIQGLSFPHERYFCHKFEQNLVARCSFVWPTKSGCENRDQRIILKSTISYHSNHINHSI